MPKPSRWPSRPTAPSRHRRGLDWTLRRPEGHGGTLAVTKGDELKLVFPQHGTDPARFEAMDFDALLLQQRWTAWRGRRIPRRPSPCLEHPRWRLSLQTHKLLGIP